MSEQTFQLVEVIRQRLRSTFRRVTLAELSFGLVLIVGILSAAWVISVAVEAGLWLDRTPRTVLFWTLGLTTAGLFIRFLLLPALRLAGLLRPPSDERVARQVGGRYPEIGDRLVNLLDLAEGRRSPAPDDMIDGAVRMLGESVRDVRFEEMEDFRSVRRAGRYATLPLLALLVFLLAAPGTFLGASMRLLSPGTFYQRPAPFELMVEPGTVELARGASLDIAIRATGSSLPKELTLALNNEEEDLVEEVKLSADSTGTFRHTVVNVRRPLRYRVSAAPVRSQWYAVDVRERPLVRGLQLTVNFPRYTGIPQQRLDPNVGDVTALPGTRVSIEVGVGGDEVEEAFLLFDDGRTSELSLDGRSASGSFLLNRDGTYQIRVRNARGVENDAPITYSLKRLSDAHPAIVLIEPGPDAALGEDLEAGLHLRLNDDFGFSRLQLFYRMAETRFGQTSDSFRTVPLDLTDPSKLDQEVWHNWLLGRTSGLDPVPGDVIEYYVQVWDNDAVAGFKSSRTPAHRLRVPSLAERYQRLEEEQSETEQHMEDVLQQTQNIDEQFKELQNELRQKQEADWEDRRQLEQLQQRQEQLERQVEEMTEKFESMTEDVAKESLVNQETLELYKEMQKVMEEINSPELMDALRKLQQAIEDMNLPQMQEAMENFEFSEQQYQDRLERALELFKKLRTQQKIDQASRLAEELARRQERLAEETKKLQEKEQQKDRGKEQGEQKDAEKKDGEKKDGEQKDGEKKDGARTDEGQKNGERTDGEQKDGEKKDGEQKEGEKKDGDQKEGEQSDDKSREGDRKESGDKSPEDLAREQKRSSEDMSALEKQLEELQQQMNEMRNSPSQEMREISNEVKKQQLPKKMQENSQQLQEGELQDAQKGQQQMQQQLEQLQQQLSQMNQSMQGQQKQVNMQGLRRALSDVLMLSQRQEDLRGTVRTNSSEQPALREDARQQVELAENLSTVSDSLQKLSRDIPQMTREVQRQAGESLRAMGKATEAMAERAVNQASGHQKTSMMHLNELALLLSDLMDQLMNQQNSGSGGMSMEQMMEQLQQMSGQQQQLNEQIQQFLNDVQGNRLSGSAQQRLEQMRQQQEAIRQQLKQMGRNPEARGKALGDLNKIAEQMEETIRELERRHVDRRTIQRQQQILSRLLDAQKSLRERGEEKQREGREGRDVTRQSPAELTPAEEAEKLRRDLIRALESGYAPDYEELIKRYFELLQRME